MPIYVLAMVFALLVVVALIRARARTKKLRRAPAPAPSPKAPVSASDFPEDVYGSQERARDEREDLDKHRHYEEAKRQRLAVAEAKRVRQDAARRVRRYRRWWLKAVLAMLTATAALSLTWGFLDARGLVPQPVQKLLSEIARQSTPGCGEGSTAAKPWWKFW